MPIFSFFFFFIKWRIDAEQVSIMCLSKCGQGFNVLFINSLCNVAKRKKKEEKKTFPYCFSDSSEREREREKCAEYFVIFLVKQQLL